MEFDPEKQVSFARNVIKLLQELQSLTSKRQRNAKKIEIALLTFVNESYANFVDVSDEYYSVVLEIQSRLEPTEQVDKKSTLQSLQNDFVQLRGEVALKRQDVLEGSSGMIRALEGNTANSEHSYSFKLFVEMVLEMRNFFLVQHRSIITSVLTEIDIFVRQLDSYDDEDRILGLEQLYVLVSSLIPDMEKSRGRVSLLRNQIVAHLATRT